MKHDLNRIAARISRVTIAGLLKSGAEGVIQAEQVLKTLGLKADTNRTFTVSGSSATIPLEDGKRLTITLE
jgi:hypothetical protein